MLIMAFLEWWYGAGWKRRVFLLKERLMGTIDYFSIGLLAKTLFAPFRQISAGRVNGSLAVQLHAFFDRLTSRLIGAFVRTGMIVIGTITIMFHSILGTLWLLLWAFVPLLPFVGLYLFLTRWMPWKL